MPQPIRIALDAMGGDFGPEVTIAGAALALEHGLDADFLLYGDETAVRAQLAKFPQLGARSRVIHAAFAVRMDDKPSVALRQGRRVSSMWMAVEAVKKGEAQAAVSAGNTGALMAMAKVCLKTIARIDRPALACQWQTLRGRSIVLDVGATIGADARHLVDLAIMGAAMARITLGVETPTVGLLNVGEEEIKGAEEVKTASKLLRDNPPPGMDYRGFVEGNGIGKGLVDVVVVEGFTGNITLKTAEGTASQVFAYLKDALKRHFWARVGFALAYPFARAAIQELRAVADPRRNAGAVFLGVEGVVIKSHGGADAFGVARAIEIGYEMARDNLPARIREAAAIAHADEGGALAEESKSDAAE
ncbi:MAG TPA: phosphate acyltransferase PlsX [Methylocystis sp.]|nr:phosphate acyltransferase PlsX [Methylocystis sp.]